MSLALVTGATGGIGLDVARLLAAREHDLVLVARRAQELERLAAELQQAHGVTVHHIASDLGAPGAADALADTLAARGLVVDILVNNAGIGQYGLYAATDAAQEAQMVQLNVVALTALTKRLLPGMVQRRRGHVLNVASTAAFFPGPLMAVYYATKAYVLSLSEALSEETRGTGVSVTALCPGPTATGFQAEAKMQESRLLKVAAMLPVAEVARQGVEGMFAGRRVVVPGIANKVMVAMRRLTPTGVLLRLVRAAQG
ncbi:MAG: SDR family oxidoreductase [Gemmatimonadaceae bacterium]|nr:SDR family oxidoreductase [Gemmatimonadaceae bacterium]